MNAPSPETRRAADPAEVQAALVSLLQSIPQFGGRVGDQWPEPQASDLPCARVGVTDSAENGPLELTATIHISQRSNTTEIIDAVRKALGDTLLIGGRTIANWRLIFTEIRPNKRATGYRALLRYQALRTTSPGSWLVDA